MRVFLLIQVVVAMLAVGCCEPLVVAVEEGSTPVKEEVVKVENPLLVEFDTPFGVPPFDKVDDEHCTPAFEAAIAKHDAEVAAITSNEDGATFDNTVAALDYSGGLLNKVAGVFFPKHSADTNDDIQDIAKEMAPVLSTHEDAILMNADLFARVKSVYEARADLSLTGEQERLLEETYKDFVRGGALLNDEDKARLWAL